uniref:Uncharacterized protein n=1 Tax=viral metagenome TaxID=1070528 RepID=A0A6C0F9H7_9ZZZZ|tara:strand:+ start:1213 stop:1341 length:129 start_codon:yes stop_codon:yes gene_type:complete
MVRNTLKIIISVLTFLQDLDTLFKDDKKETGGTLKSSFKVCS